MKFSGLLQIALSIISTTSYATSTGESCCRSDVTSSSYHRHMLNQYISVWDGDLSLVKSTFHPDVKLFSDRFPSSTGNGSTLTAVTNRDEFAAFIENARVGWEKYTFDPIRWVSNGHQIVVRWKMEGILGSNFTRFPT